MSAAQDLVWITQTLLFTDTRAFDKLVLKYQSQVRRFLLRLTGGNAPLSDDLAQETFLTAYLRLESFKGKAGFSTWLLSIAYRKFYDTLRQSKEAFEEDLQEEMAEANPEAWSFDLNYDLDQALATLRADERSAILLFYMEDLSVEKIAQVMQVPVGTVKSHLARARQKLKVFLSETGYGSESSSTNGR